MGFVFVSPTPALQNLDAKLAIANRALQADQRFSRNPLMRLLHQQPTHKVTSQDDMCNLHAYPNVWQYREQVTLESLRQYVERQKSPVEGATMGGLSDQQSLALLKKFLEKVNTILNIRISSRH